MSETRHYKGKLIYQMPQNPKETLELQAKRILKVDKPKDFYGSFLEQLQDERYEEFVVIKDKLYEVRAQEIDADDDMYNAHKINGKDYEFEVRFYDGGQSFDEAVATAVRMAE